MNSNEQNINNWFADFEHRFKTTVPNIVAETAVEFFQDTFKKQAWDGVPWQQLSTKYAKKKTRGKGRILTASGILMRSIRPSQVNVNRIVITAGSTKAPYAKVHNEGLRVTGARKVRSYTNSNFMGKGKSIQIKGHTRTVNYKMPRRQFMGHSKYLNTILMDRLTKAFNN